MKFADVRKYLIASHVTVAQSYAHKRKTGSAIGQLSNRI
jgi:hypothetical protein